MPNRDLRWEQLTRVANPTLSSDQNVNLSGIDVTLPNGSKIEDSSSPSGNLIAPFADLSRVARAGQKLKDRMAREANAPFAEGAPGLDLIWTLGRAVGHGGEFDFHRGSGNSITGFERRPQFLHVSSFNIGLMCQQAGLSLDDTLNIAGSFASVRSNNYDPQKPYGLPNYAREFIQKGFAAGASGLFDSATVPPPSTQ